MKLFSFFAALFFILPPDAFGGFISKPGGLNLTCSNGQVPEWAGGATGGFTSCLTASGTGTVTSVAFSDGSTSPLYSVSGSPVTSSGTLEIILNSQSANCILSGPSSGSAAQPTCRTMVKNDLPSIFKTNSYTASTVAQFDTAGNLQSSSVSTTTLGYLDATSSVQTQLNAKVGTGANSTLTSFSGITGSIASPTYIDFIQSAQPSNPSSGHMRVWMATDGNYYMVNSSGTASQINGGGGGGTAVTARYHVNASQSITANEFNQLNFATADYDANSIVSNPSTAWTFTAPSAGIWQICANFQSNGTGSAQDFEMALFINGSKVANIANNVINGTYAGLGGCTQYHFNTGDTGTVQLYCTTNITLENQGYSNWVTVNLLN